MIGRYLFAAVCLLLTFPVSAGTTYRPKPYPYTAWECDSLFVGASLVAKDSVSHVVVTLKNTIETLCEGSLFFMVPGQPGSARFVFHNLHDRHPAEPTMVDLGVFSAGTPLYFRYVVTDTTLHCGRYRNVQLYTGQGRTGTDPYVSERSTDDYGKAWAAIGRIGDSSAEVAFDGNECYSHRGIIFKVAGVAVVR